MSSDWKRAFEQAISDYLVCPNDRGNLRPELSYMTKANGALKCRDCGTKYQVRDGISYFYDPPFLNPRTRSNIVSTALKLRKDPREAILLLNGLGKRTIGLFGLDETRSASLMQFLGMLRYDIEAGAYGRIEPGYEGTFKSPDDVRDLIQGDLGEGLLVEWGCGPGDNVADLLRYVPFTLGIDISGQMVSETNKRLIESGKGLGIQADISNLPLRDGIIRTGMTYNVLDRVGGLRNFADEVRRTMDDSGVLIAGGCEKPQWCSPGDPRLVYVPRSQRLEDEDGYSTPAFVRETGFKDFIFDENIPWRISTYLDGSENLETRVIVARR